MNVAIVVCRPDTAGINILERLLEDFDFVDSGEKYDGNPVYAFGDNVRLYTSETDSIHCERIDEKIYADLYIFATKHKARSGIPSLSVHSPGNWGKAEYGGQDRKLCVCPALYLRRAYLLLNENKVEGYDAVMEVTHHGPYIEKPIMFIEIGSSEEQWKDKTAGKAIAKTIMQMVEGEPQQAKVAMGIGGLHTCPIFNKIVLREEIALGHVCPKYMLHKLDKEMITQAMEKSNAEYVLLDWKGMGKEKERIVSMLDELGLKYEKIRLN